jgi:putative transposase
MKCALDKEAHSEHTRQYKLVQCVKYRKKVLVSKRVVKFLRSRVGEVSVTFNVEILIIKRYKDHFPMLFKAKPTLKVDNQGAEL